MTQDAVNLFLVTSRLCDLKLVIGDLSIAILNDETGNITKKQFGEILQYLRQYRNLLEEIQKVYIGENKK